MRTTHFYGWKTNIPIREIRAIRGKKPPPVYQPNTHHMKLISLATIVFLTFTCHLMAERNNSGVNQSFLETAKKYDQQAEKAAENGHDHNAAIYRQLAQIKREAAVHKGSYDWSQYHKLKGQLRHGKGKKAHSKKAKTPKNDHIAAAQKQAALANKANKSGDNYASQIHTRMAAILIDAAAKKSDNKRIDWTEYKELTEMLNKHLE